MLEKAAAINCIWFVPCYRQGRDLLNKWGFYCADLLTDSDADLSLKYQDRIIEWGVQIIQYLAKTLLK